MRRDPLLFAALFSAAIAATAGAQQAAQAPQLTAQSSYRVRPRSQNCTFGYQTVSTRYTVVGSTALEGPPPHLVLEERTSIDQCENLEGPTSAEVTVIARPARSPSARPVWTIRQRGERGEVEERYGNVAMYRVTEYGCCGSEDLDTYYSLGDGRRLFTADHPLLTLDAQPFGTGVVAVHDDNAAGSPGAQDDGTLVAVVTLAPGKGPVQRLQVRGPSNDFAVTTLELVARGPGGALKHGERLEHRLRPERPLDGRRRPLARRDVRERSEGARGDPDRRRPHVRRDGARHRPLPRLRATGDALTAGRPHRPALPHFRPLGLSHPPSPPCPSRPGRLHLTASTRPTRGADFGTPGPGRMAERTVGR